MDSEELEPRVAALENQVRDLTGRVRGSEHDAAAARVLAGAADRDVSELRDFRSATTSSFNALRQDFVDLRQDFADLRGQFDRGFAEMLGKFDAAAAGQQQIVELIQTVINDRGRGADG